MSATTPSQDNFAKQPAVLSNTIVRQRFSHVAAIDTKHDDEANMPTQRTNLLSSAKRTRSPPLLSQEDDFLGLYNPPISDARRSATSPNWNNQPNQPVNLSYVTNSQRLSPVSGGTTQHSEANIPLKSNDFNVARRTKSPPLPAREDGFVGLYNPPNANARRSATSLNWNNQPNQSVNFPYITNSGRLSPVGAGGTTQHSENNIPLKSIDFNVAKRTKSPPLPAREDDFLGHYNPPNANARRREVFPTDVRSRMKFLDGTADPSPLQMSDVVNSSVRTSSLSRPAYLNPPKRARSPPSQYAEAFSTSSSIQLDSESEIQAKAKRLARFGVELSQPLKTPQDSARHKFLANSKEQVSRKPADSPGEEAYGATGTHSDYEGIRSSTVVVGICPDMCPEPEREERERKGDLDRFERLDGDRNQTSKFLAVKKYNRTAEREADLIRPLPILRLTADYLLSLLDQPYDENFLGTYNFLWDRMRAIRMDLRMQHIFNQEAIYMLEQMIRLHIIAMHELCEYQRGEGFVEGFDAHLNIEQMNKTSVELFQMYDDHRKRGKDISTEEEFRGYYALLKLDKHPGYKVEPSELSLDLAKMTPELRSKPDILFARNVARACRLGNYITFFQLARKATYLQACLMHAHFAKLRTQALASLHSGLQNNQGIPVSLVVKWLGMEGEDIESLLEYHGFSLRKYEELYMVKEGSFLNIDSDYPTKCSQLVHLKRSRSIVDDVKSGPSLAEITEEIQTKPDTPEIAHRETRLSKVEDPINMADGEMLDFNVDSVPRPISQPLQLLEKTVPAVCNREDDHELSDVSLASWHVKKDRELSDVSLASWNAKKNRKIMEASLVVATSPSEDSVTDQEHFEDRALGPSGIVVDTSLYGFALSNEIVSAIPARVPAISNVNYITTDIVPQRDAERNVEHEASQLVSRQRDEAVREKLRLILRKWKEQSSRMREIRDQREFVANAALSSLSLGPPIRRQTVQSFTAEELNIDYIARERHGKLGKSWARLNVSELVAPILSTRNPDAKCITWKLLFLVQANGTEGQIYNLASKWLLSKLMGSDSEIDIDLSVSLPGLAIWKKWTDTQTCCLSIVREMKLHYNQQFCQNDRITGSSCLLFLASGTISWDIQRVQLHKVLMFVPSDSRLPLLVLATDSFTDNGADPSSTIVNRLGLHEIDKRKISSFSVIFLQADSFFNDDHLKEGLQWLAVHSPHQPTLHLLKTRELISSYLRISTSVLENLNFAELSPGNCISAFNEALDRSAAEIIDSASANPNNWPSPEIDLLEKFSEERFVANMYLPSTGWSSAGRIEPVISAINSCRLPDFPNDLSWLSQGSRTVRELQSHKSALEECLVSYLTHSTKLMSFELAVREASVMVQKGAGLELRGSSHCIVPKWLVIFRRIYNWQLMRLNEKKLSEVYILANKDCSSLHSSSGAVTRSEVAHFVGKNLENDFNSEWDQTVHSVQNEVSLDELVELSCNIPFKEQPVSTSNIERSSSRNEEPNDMHRTNNFAQEVEVLHPVDRDEPTESPVSIKDDSRLAMLLEQCNRLQDMISEKLSIYF